jgi:hypothetical protein
LTHPGKKEDILRRIQVALIATALVAITAGPAWAGGAWLDPSWVRVEAGDRVELSANVSPGAYGWLDDGPFFTYLQGETYGLEIGSGNGGVATDVPLGPLETMRRGGGGITAAVAFTLPVDMPPGEYWVTVCNDPCTTGLGDLTGGVIFVGMDPPPDEEEAEAIPVAGAAAVSIDPPNAAGDAASKSTPLRLALAPAPARPSDLSPIWVGISAAFAGAVLLTALLSRQRS